MNYYIHLVQLAVCIHTTVFDYNYSFQLNTSPNFMRILGLFSKSYYVTYFCCSFTGKYKLDIKRMMQEFVAFNIYSLNLFMWSSTLIIYVHVELLVACEHIHMSCFLTFKLLPFYKNSTLELHISDFNFIVNNTWICC